MREEINFSEAINLLRRIKQNALYMKSFSCDNPMACGQGAICNSCWTRNWAEELLKEI